MGINVFVKQTNLPLLWLSFKRVVLQVSKLQSVSDSCLLLLSWGMRAAFMIFIQKAGFSTLICLLTPSTHASASSVLEYSWIRKRKLLLWTVGGSITYEQRFLFSLAYLLPSISLSFSPLLSPHHLFSIFSHLFHLLSLSIHLYFIPSVFIFHSEHRKLSRYLYYCIFILTNVLHPEG